MKSKQTRHARACFLVSRLPLRADRHKFWQGWKESNLRMPESKSGALTNLATPLHGIAIRFNWLQTDKSKILKPDLATASAEATELTSLPTQQRMSFEIAALSKYPA